MQIDWLTVVAQIVNFLVLIWLLQRFLYAPITEAMARRERRIAERMDEARDARAAAEDEARELREARHALEADREEAMEAARAEAQALRARLEAELREEVDAERRARLAQLDEDREQIVRSLRRSVCAEVIETVRASLRDFADAELAGRVAATFVDRLAAIDAEGRARLARAAEAAGGAAVVESGFELPATLRAQVTRAIHRDVAPGIEVDYRTDGSETLDLRLRLGERTVEWGPDRHLDRIAARLEEELDAAVAAHARR